MPYGDLAAQAVQRFEHYEDLEAADATIEEREEYEPHLAEGNLVFAGIDYERILRAAEQEADVVLWDGGNNDTPFIKPDVHIVVVDPHRPGHELRYHPGETNLRMADVCVVNKIDSASQDGIDAVLNSIHENSTDARVVLAASPFEVEGDPEEIRGKRVLAIEDGPTLTHGVARRRHRRGLLRVGRLGAGRAGRRARRRAPAAPTRTAPPVGRPQHLGERRL